MHLLRWFSAIYCRLPAANLSAIGSGSGRSCRRGRSELRWERALGRWMAVFCPEISVFFTRRLWQRHFPARQWLWCGWCRPGVPGLGEGCLVLDSGVCVAAPHAAVATCQVLPWCPSPVDGMQVTSSAPRRTWGRCHPLCCQGLVTEVAVPALPPSLLPFLHRAENNHDKSETLPWPRQGAGSSG